MSLQNADTNAGSSATTTATHAALGIRDLNMAFGAVRVIEDVSIAIPQGARHAVIGPNGAGKTTLFNLVTGWLKPVSGSILLDGQDIVGCSPSQVAFKGLSRSFQLNTLFAGLTVQENLRLAAQAQDSSRFNPFFDRRTYRQVLERGAAAAERMDLTRVLDRRVDELSYGEKRQLEVGLALCTEPKVLLLDEPAAGTSPAERQKLIGLIDALPREVTLVLVEHDMDVVFSVCERITVLDYGRVLATDTPDAIRASSDVRDAYLGKKSDA